VDQLSTELFTGKGVAPVTEATFGELHDVALVNQGDGGAIVIDCVLNGLAHQTLRAFDGHGLDTQTGSFGEADLVDAEFILQEGDQLAGLFAAGFKFNTCVDVFRVFTEDDHVGLLGFTNRRRHTLEVLNGAQADVKVELLAQGHVQRTDATAHGRGQRALDGHDVVTHSLEGFVGQPDIGAVNLGGLFPCIDFHPVNLALAAISLGNCSVHHLEHDRGDIYPRTVALDIRDDGLVRYIEREIGIDRNLLAPGGNLDMLVGHECSRDRI